MGLCMLQRVMQYKLWWWAASLPTSGWEGCVYGLVLDFHDAPAWKTGWRRVALAASWILIFFCFHRSVSSRCPAPPRPSRLFLEGGRDELGDARDVFVPFRRKGD